MDSSINNCREKGFLNLVLINKLKLHYCFYRLCHWVNYSVSFQYSITCTKYKLDKYYWDSGEPAAIETVRFPGRIGRIRWRRMCSSTKGLQGCISAYSLWRNLMNWATDAPPSAYSPDLIASDHFLFPYLKKWLSGKGLFGSHEENIARKAQKAKVTNLRPKTFLCRHNCISFKKFKTYWRTLVWRQFIVMNSCEINWRKTYSCVFTIGR